MRLSQWVLDSILSTCRIKHCMSRLHWSDMEGVLLGLEEKLRAAAQEAVEGVVARTRQEVKRVLEAAERERAAGVREVARLRAELAQEAAAMQKVQAAHRSRVVLDVGGVRHVTSVATLRSRPGSMLDAMFSGTQLMHEH